MLSNLEKLRVKRKPVEITKWDILISQVKNMHLEGTISKATCRNYTYRIQAFSRFVNVLPEEVVMGDIERFVHHLQLNGASASSQNQALNATRFLFRELLNKDPAHIGADIIDRRVKLVPTILTLSEAKHLISCLSPPYKLIAQLIYGCGMRLTECLSLRLGLVNITTKTITILGEKGINRIVPIPYLSIDEVHQQMIKSIDTFIDDCEAGFSGSFMSKEFIKSHNADPTKIGWQWLFPAVLRTTTLSDGEQRRSYLHQTHFQKEIVEALRRSKIEKNDVTAKTLRHSCCVHLLEHGCHVKDVQKLLGHSDIRTTEFYYRLMKPKNKIPITSPLDLEG